MLTGKKVDVSFTLWLDRYLIMTELAYAVHQISSKIVCAVRRKSFRQMLANFFCLGRSVIVRNTLILYVIFLQEKHVSTPHNQH